MDHQRQLCPSLAAGCRDDVEFVAAQLVLGDLEQFPFLEPDVSLQEFAKTLQIVHCPPLPGHEEPPKHLVLVGKSLDKL